MAITAHMPVRPVLNKPSMNVNVHERKNKRVVQLLEKADQFYPITEQHVCFFVHS